MKTIKEQLKAIFQHLDQHIERMHLERRNDGRLLIPKCEVKLLGQMSLLANERVSMVLALAQTADMDALLLMDNVVKGALMELLRKHGLLYDEDSYLIWIPKGAKFETLFSFKNIIVRILDPESALVSKAVKAPAKNKQLVRQAIASGEFPGLVERIEKSGGHIEFFAED